MKSVKTITFLALLFSFIAPALHANSQREQKLYLDTQDIAIDGKKIYVYIQDDWVKTHAIRTDAQGFYVNESDMMRCGSRITPETWQCPYCHRWWLLGQKCDYEKCPTNQWPKDEK